MYKYGKKYETRDKPLLYTNELVAVYSEPNYVIAGRRIFKLKLKRKKAGNVVIPFLIIGKDNSEMVFVYLEQQIEFNLTISVRIIRKRTTDFEISAFLSIALLNILAKEYEFAPNIIPFIRRGRLVYK